MPRDDKTEALLEMLIDVVWTAHKLRAAGAGEGAVNASGGGTWGVLHTLVLHGPKTVPQIARMRPVARQHIQTLANELAGQGLVTFDDNPSHKRSKLVVITKAGKAHHDKVKMGLVGALQDISRDLPQSDVDATGRVLDHIMGELDKRIAGGDG